MSLNFIIGTLTGGAAPAASPSEYFDSQTGDIDFTDEQFQDAIPGIAMTNFTMRNPAAFVEFRTEATDFDVKVGGNWSAQGEESKIYLLVNDVYNQSITLTDDDVTESHAIASLEAGTKNIKLVCGYAASAHAGGDMRYPRFGTYVQGVDMGAGTIEVKIPVVPTKRIVADGMSITTGASGTRFTLTGWLPQFKWVAGYNIKMVSYGARGLCDNGGGWNSTKADQLVAYHLAQFEDGVTEKEIWMDLHTNDFGLFQVSKASFKARVEEYVDKINTADPEVLIIWWRPLARTDGATPNSSGAVLQDFADALDEVAASRSSFMIVLGAASDGGGSGNTIDGVHYNQTGHDDAYETRLALYEAL